ncbi:Histidinol-phosphate aminotransferase [compost metagenome]
MQALQQLEMVQHITPSDANFVLVKMNDPRGVYTHLVDQGIIVRDRSKVELCEGCLRITIGTPEENQILLEKLTTINI